MAEESHPLEELAEARNRAVRLVEGLEQKQKELLDNPPELPPEKLAFGKMAMENAVAAARRTLAALNDAIEIAHRDGSNHER